MRILLLDIETAPNIAHVWGLFNQNIGLPQLVDASYTLCWAAKWYGEKEIFFQSVHGTSPKRMTKAIHKLVDEADAVVHYNGTRFDMPILSKDFLLHGIPPPAPYKQIDLLRVVRQRFRFPSNKLAHISQALGVGSKSKHSGHELWLKCMAGDDAAWKAMERYNKQDVRLLEQVYDKLKPWIKGHANHGLYNADNSEVCPKCGSETYQRRGLEHTATCTYQRFQCCKCHGWFRSVRNVGPKPSKKFANL